MSEHDHDQAAARRLFWDLRQRLEALQSDLISLGRALDGPPGEVSALADQLLDEDQNPIPCPGQHEAGASATANPAP